MKKIKAIEIKNSLFYEDVRIEFSDKLNCIMGGRGTGKTTLLYFIKAAIDNNLENSDSAYKILRSNLGNGSILLELEDEDGNLYNIIKTLNEEPQPYKIPGQEYVSIEKIWNEIECDIYEAGRIEEIGRSSRDRLELLDKKIKYEIKEIDNYIRKVQIDLDANSYDIKTFNKKLAQMNEILSQYQSVEEEFNIHKEQQPTGINEEEKKGFETADSKEKIRKDEKRFFNKTIDALNSYSTDIEHKKNELLDYFLISIEDKERFDNKELMSEGFNITISTVNKIKLDVEREIHEVNEAKQKLGIVFSKLLENHDIQQAEFIKLKQKFEINKDYINKFHSLSKKTNEKQTLLKDKDELNKKRDRLKDSRLELVKKLNILKQDIFNKRLEAVKELNLSFGGDIVITLTFGGITDEFQEKLKSALKGSGMRYNELIPRIVESFSSNEFASIIHSKDIQSLKNIMGIDDTRASALIDSLYETENIYEIESMYCNDLPEFKLKISDDLLNKEDNYKKTDELSMGQRCTTVLPIIFAVSKNPLIIDQPEDNLDNKYITQRIHQIIKNQKEQRQIIFITHNPNIPVLSDAEQNIFLLYENRKSKIEMTGTVDEVKDKIINLLEGGAKAFEKRMQIYGYSHQ